MASKYPQSPYRRDVGDFPPLFDDIADGRVRIDRERNRQVHVLGYDIDHDAEHDLQELADAANCYLYEASHGHGTPPPSTWPWEHSAWKPSSERLRNLEKAGALYMAAADLARHAAGNIGDLIDQEIEERLKSVGVL